MGHVESPRPESFEIFVDARVLGQMEAEKALGVADVGDEAGENARIKPCVVQVDALDVQVVDDQPSDAVYDELWHVVSRHALHITCQALRK